MGTNISASNPAYSALPVAESSDAILVQVAAPAALPEGFRFEASFEGNTFTVTVPKGGVTEGQTFTVPYTPGSPAGIRIETDAFLSVESPDIPTGQWRDGLCDCLRFGPFHPSFLSAWCIPQLLNAQVMTRMKLDWLGVEASDEGRRNTFRNVVILLLTYFILSNIFSIPDPTFEKSEDGSFVVTSPPPSPVLVAINNVINIGFSAYTIIAVMRTRRVIRERYQIPEEQCPGWEDLCCAFFCGCCTVAQMARHTADYKKEKAACCTINGLKRTEDRPVIIV